ncbi:ATP-binding protein [Simiduia sp. 21SJ11W-1]|uniref:ATP-binding protein n=1 Tax=Simiduia sp. 21SJ11W-1 TaxID=2909669 RepID=UPI00209D712B|nr:ATP-binding protein [Simiduia sp. 21SJ11W-1]UTA46725.1 ATP-binding protein [Simiduia sp. 21SJ11W-1]
MTDSHIPQNPRLKAPGVGASLLVLAGLFTLAALYQPELSAAGIRTAALAHPWPAAALAIAALVWLIERHHFSRRCNKVNAQLSQLAQQLVQLKQSKRQLQQKAQRHSSQTDKLKAFIGDRLLEYIEYDEKYLHFKGIAAEVRHNGIISYDKIQQALVAGTRQHPNNTQYTEALASLGYLWDLLDLSTADNMALHINNHLCDCEEYYYQKQLNPTGELPIEPTFFAHNAVFRALHTHLHGAFCELNSHKSHIYFGNNSFQVFAEPECELLGNENHLVLALENLVKNALYFQQRAAQADADSSEHAQAPQKILLRLSKLNNRAELTVYNSGPHIPEQHALQIYQLGFSTRTEDQVHGKGLGLYFVKQIVAGFEGEIHHRNIANGADQYSLRIEVQGAGLEGNEIQTEVVAVNCTNGQLTCASKSEAANETDALPIQPHLRWAFMRPVISVEVTALSNGQTHSMSYKAGDTPSAFYEPALRHPPRWLLRYQPQANGRCSLAFTPLDVSGVEFTITLPLADAHLQAGEETAPLDAAQEDAYIETIAERFKPIDATNEKDA